MTIISLLARNVHQARQLEINYTLSVNSYILVSNCNKFTSFQMFIIKQRYL